MGLKLLDYGPEGSGKTAFAVTMSEIGNIGVIDTESRWQFYTEPHPTVKPRKPSEAAIKAGAPEDIYANPRRVRQDISWLPKNDNVIWLVQTLDPSHAWECSKIWARDKSIIGQVQDSRSVLWDLLQDTRKTVSENGKPLGGLSWEPVKRVDRRMNYTLLEGGQHWVLNAHKQEIMNEKMQVTGSKPWMEKRSGHWIDLSLQFTFPDGEERPKARVEKEKILGGIGGALKKGTILNAPTFRQILMLAGNRENVTNMAPVDEILHRTDKLVESVGGSPAIPGVDDATVSK